jgi:hypothetical protein
MRLQEGNRGWTGGHCRPLGEANDMALQTEARAERHGGHTGKKTVSREVVLKGKKGLCATLALRSLDMAQLR